MNLLRTDEGDIVVSYQIYCLSSAHLTFTGEGARCSFFFTLHCSLMSKCHLKCGFLKCIFPQKKKKPLVEGSVMGCERVLCVCVSVCVWREREKESSVCVNEWE